MTYIKPISKKGRNQIKLDESTYEEVWDNSPSKTCEECGTYLGEDFRDFEGRVNDKRFYSHILTKASFPEHRNNPNNFNLLCPKCHSYWENATKEQKEKMNIWDNNKIIIKKLKKQSYARQNR